MTVIDQWISLCRMSRVAVTALLCSCECMLQFPSHANHVFFFLFTVSGMSIIPIKNLLEENHGGKADYFVHTVVHMHRNKHDKHMDSIHLPPPVRGEGQVSPQAKGLYLATCMSKDKNMRRGHQGWNVPVVPVVSSPLVGDDMQHLGN